MMNPMKDSGVEWIGEIPSDWNISKFKYEVATPITDGPHETPELLDEGIPFASAESVKNGRINLNLIRGYISEKDHLIYSRKVTPQRDDIFIVKSGAGTGQSGIVDVDDVFDIWSPLALIRMSKRYSQKFVFYFIQSRSFFDQVENSWSFGTQQNIGMSVIERLYLTTPPIQEQEAIAGFLDTETKKLDDAKDLLQQQIEKLKEYRKSLIWETVTKGLDKTVPMKDSGVEWIGEIPEDWAIKPIKYIYEMISSGATPKSDQTEFYDGDISWIQSGDLYQIDEVNETVKTISELGKRSSKALKIYESPFLAVAMYGASIGNLAISRIDATVNQAVAIMKDNNSKVYFGKYALEASKQELINAALGGTQPNISQMLLRNWILPQPDIEIQKSIAKFLDEKTSIVEKIISNIRFQIEVIDKQKKTLIYDYVTGKRRVI